MGQPLISVIIPVYNMELYLERCLDSVLDNTYRNLEVICIDDGSRDGSLEILRRYEAADPRVVVIAKGNGGVSSARNAGLDRMTGEYVTFVDSDDYVHPQYVELLYRALRESKVSISVCRFEKIEENVSVCAFSDYSSDLNLCHVNSFTQIFKNRLLCPYCWGKLFRVDILYQLRFREDMQFGEDTVFFAEVCKNERLNAAAVLSYPLYFYFQRDGSAGNAAKTKQFLQFGKTWCELLCESGRDDIYLDRALRWNLPIRYRATHIVPDKEAVRESKRLLKEILPHLWKTSIYGFFEKVVLLAFVYFPGIYWLHIVIGDPSMWEWEKMERKKRRQSKKHALNDDSH